jgi:hypothetical protein
MQRATTGVRPAGPPHRLHEPDDLQHPYMSRAAWPAARQTEQPEKIPAAVIDALQPAIDPRAHAATQTRDTQIRYDSFIPEGRCQREMPPPVTSWYSFEHCRHGSPISLRPASLQLSQGQPLALDISTPKRNAIPARRRILPYTHIQPIQGQNSSAPCDLSVCRR